uniref:Uncharacterized protein n=1 Tax=Rhipicephalus zambeziensis TaxID=60191 RepID=A0A224YGC8_9ACAR
MHRHLAACLCVCEMCSRRFLLRSMYIRVRLFKIGPAHKQSGRHGNAAIRTLHVPHAKMPPAGSSWLASSYTYNFCLVRYTSAIWVSHGNLRLRL